MADLTFTTIEESARHSLNISRDEYAACNYVQTWAAHPSNKTPGFCNRTRGQMALFIGISERGMQKMLTRLEGMDLIKRASQNQFLYRITEKWFDVVVSAKEERTGEQRSLHGVNKAPARGEQSSRKGVNKVPAHKEYNKEVIMSEGKTRFAPAPAENPSTLKAEKNESGLVAPPEPQFEVTAIASPSSLPGVTIIEPPKIQPWEHPNPQSPKELKAVMLRYAEQDPDNWRDNVLENGRATNWPAEKLSECLQEFCDWQFKTDFTKGKLSQYTAGFSLWLKRQPRFEAMNAPKEGGATRGGQTTQTLTSNMRVL